MIVPGSQTRSYMELHVVNIPLVMADCPFGGFLGANRIGPPEPHDAGTDGYPKPPGFRLDPAAGGTRCPRSRRFEQCRSGVDHLGTREPQPQGVDRPQLACRDPVANRLADIFGTYNKPAGRGRVEAGRLGGRTVDRCRSPALRPGGLGRSRPPVNRAARRTVPERRAAR